MNFVKKTVHPLVMILPIAMALTGCNSLMSHQKTVTKPTIDIQDTYPPLPPAKDMIRLKEGQTVKVTDKPVAVTFNKVLSDDRCPLNTQCIWAGNATVELTVTNKNDDQQTLKLSSGDLRGDLKRKASVFGQTVSLETVYPTPNANTNQQDLVGHYLIDVKVVPSTN